MSLKGVLLDFDGTFLDSGPGIMRSARQTACELGWEIPDDKAFRKFIGPPLASSFAEVFGVGPEDSARAAELYKKIYDDIGAIDEACVYPGMLEALRELKKSGIRVGIASAKRMPLLTAMAHRYGGEDLFEVIAGATEETPGEKKAQIVAKGVSELGLQPDEVLMVGDTHYDADAAIGAGTPFCGVTWGYGFETEDEVRTQYPGAHAISRAKQLQDLFQTTGDKI